MIYRILFSAKDQDESAIGKHTPPYRGGKRKTKQFEGRRGQGFLNAWELSDTVHDLASYAFVLLRDGREDAANRATQPRES